MRVEKALPTSWWSRLGDGFGVSSTNTNLSEKDIIVDVHVQSQTSFLFVACKGCCWLGCGFPVSFEFPPLPSKHSSVCLAKEFA